MYSTTSWEWLFSHDRQTRDTANTIQGRQEPEIGACWVIEVVVPLRQDSDIVQHRSARKSYLVGTAYVLEPSELTRHNQLSQKRHK